MNSAKVMNKQSIYFLLIQLSKALLKILIPKNRGKNQISIFNIKQYQCQLIALFTKKFFFRNSNNKDHVAILYSVLMALRHPIIIQTQSKNQLKEK